MGYLAHIKPRDRYDPRFILDIWEKIRTAVNHLDETNFSKEGVSGDAILKPHSVGLERLRGGEIHMPIILLAQPYTTTNTSLENVGPYVFWSPTRWRGVSGVYFEVVGGPVTAGASAVFELHDGNGLLASINVDIPGYQHNLVKIESPSEQAGTWLMKMRTTSSSVAAGILGARVIVHL